MAIQGGGRVGFGKNTAGGGKRKKEQGQKGTVLGFFLHPPDGTFCLATYEAAGKTHRPSPLQLDPPSLQALLLITLSYSSPAISQNPTCRLRAGEQCWEHQAPGRSWAADGLSQIYGGEVSSLDPWRGEHRVWSQSETAAVGAGAECNRNPLVSPLSRTDGPGQRSGGLENWLWN